MKWIVEQRTLSVRGIGGHAARILSAIIGFAAIATAAGLVADIAPAHAKTPGKRYCYKGVCHRVKTIAETRRDIGRVRVVSASHYDSCDRDRFNPCGLTSSGERFRPGAADNTASPVYPDGTRLLVWNPRNGKTAVVRVNNAGPYRGRRELDLSRAAAQKLGFYHRGVARLHLKVLSAPTRAEARYRRNRHYKPVPGYVGAFASIDTALLSVSRAISGLFASPVHAVAGRHTPVEARRILALETKAQRRANRRIAALATSPSGARRVRKKARSAPARLRVAALAPSSRKRSTRSRTQAAGKRRPVKSTVKSTAKSTKRNSRSTKSAKRSIKRSTRPAKSTPARRRRLPASVVAQSARKKKKGVKVAALRNKAGKRASSQRAASKGAGKKETAKANRKSAATATSKSSAASTKSTKKIHPVSRSAWKRWLRRARHGGEA